MQAAQKMGESQKYITRTIDVREKGKSPEAAERFTPRGKGRIRSAMGQTKIKKNREGGGTEKGGEQSLSSRGFLS